MAQRSINPEPSANGNDGLSTFNSLYQQLDLLRKSENYAFQILSNRAEAEDIALVAYLRVATKIANNQGYLRSEDNISSLIYKTVHNLCFDAFRSRERAGLISIDALLTNKKTGESFVIADKARDFDALDAKLICSEALESLADLYYEPVVLKDVENLTSKEAAHCLKLSVPAFKSRLYRGRQLLRVRLTEMGLDKGLMRRRFPT